jgi:hypothetical protein
MEDLTVDVKRFDHVSRALAYGASRRALLAALAGFTVLELGAVKSASSRHRAANRPDKSDKPDKPGKPKKVVVCHKPGTRAERTIEVAAASIPAHLDHGDHLDACCEKGHVYCDGHCCPPPPQGGKAVCCPDGWCGCAGECCAEACFFRFPPSSNPNDEFCCAAPEQQICPIDEKTATCCLTSEVCPCLHAGGIAGSYRRPGR